MMDMRRFYLIASILMIISLLGSVWNLFIVWNGITIGGKISQLAGGVGFNLLLFILFIGLYRITPSMNLNPKVIESPDLDALIKKYSSTEDKGKDIAQNKYNAKNSFTPSRKGFP